MELKKLDGSFSVCKVVDYSIQGILDFSLIGILSEISTLLAKKSIGIFAISTYNTDYILMKEEQFENAVRILAEAGYRIL